MTNISQEATDLIVFSEISSQAYYNKALVHPTWPEGDSGVTIGIGYDLGYQTQQEVQDDWGSLLSQGDVDDLIQCVGLKGENGRAALDAVRHIIVPYDAARQVFDGVDVPRWTLTTIKAFPGSEVLSPDSLGALVSLVFNRGPSMGHPANASDWNRRLEMRRIRDAIARNQFDLVAPEIEAMKRLWLNKGMDGLVDRRIAEANLFKQGLNNGT